MVLVGITGAGGMVGRALVKEAQNRSLDFVAIRRGDISSPQISQEKLRLADFRVVRTFEQLDTLLGDVAVVIHAAAAVPAASRKMTDDTIFDINVRFTELLGQWCASRSKKMIFISGATVYEKVNSQKISEDSPLGNSGVGGYYGYSKLLAERALEQINDLTYCCLRPSSVYGPGLEHNKLIMQQLDTAAQDKTITVYPPHDDRTDLIFSEDLAWACFEAIEKNVTGIFNIAGGTLYSMEEIALACVKVAGKGTVQLEQQWRDPVRAGEIRFNLDCSKAVKHLNFHPKMNLEKGLRAILSS
ncbi:MAG: hypothetical protein COT73_00305 [Bdellovibrio sp. CG10_big_fil_rev_8_21_14_0_10_47_8]|nr:MAG: hypothetical protein COT73_00305 [Bdellovibrio sp. CG10_big_fil_rev_8_21_14_0_10_47_8]